MDRLCTEFHRYFPISTAIKRSYVFVGNGQKVRQKFVGIYRRTSDDSDGYIIDRNVVGKSSVYTDEFPTNVTVIYLIGMSLELRRYIPTHTLWSESRWYIPTNFQRSSIFCFRRNAVGNSSNVSDDFVVRRNVRWNIACFLVVIGFKPLSSRTLRGFSLLPVGFLVNRKLEIYESESFA